MDGIFFRADLELFEEAVIQRPKTGPTAFTQHRGTVAALTVVADGRDGALRLRIIQANEERENLDLSLYVRGAHAARARGTHDFSQDMPIYGCVDEANSRLAMRYHLAQAHIRITRLLFQQADQCALLAQIMKDRGMPMRPMTAPRERPLTAPGDVCAQHTASSTVGDAVIQFGALNNAPVLNEQRFSRASSTYPPSHRDPRSSTEIGTSHYRSGLMPGEYPVSSELSLPHLPLPPHSTCPKTTAPYRPVTSTFSSLDLPDLPKPTPVTGRPVAGHLFASMTNRSQGATHPGQSLESGSTNQLGRGQQDVNMDDYTLPPSAQGRNDGMDSSQFGATPYTRNPQQHASQDLGIPNTQNGKNRTQDEFRDSALDDDDDADGLRAFIQQPKDERRAFLDNYLLEKLDDPNFVKLCEDLEACWRARLYGQK